MPMFFANYAFLLFDLALVLPVVFEHALPKRDAEFVLFALVPIPDIFDVAREEEVLLEVLFDVVELELSVELFALVLALVLALELEAFVLLVDFAVVLFLAISVHLP